MINQDKNERKHSRNKWKMTIGLLAFAVLLGGVGALAFTGNIKPVAQAEQSKTVEKLHCTVNVNATQSEQCQRITEAELVEYKLCHDQYGDKVAYTDFRAPRDGNILYLEVTCHLKDDQTRILKYSYDQMTNKFQEQLPPELQGKQT